MAATYTIQRKTLTDIADAIRIKSGQPTFPALSMTPLGMPSAIMNIPTGGGEAGYNEDNSTVTTFSGMTRVTVSSSNSWNGTNTYYTFTNWKDYFASPEDIEILIFRVSQNMVCIYIKGLCPIYDNGYLGVVRMNYSSSRTTVSLPDSTYTSSSTYSLVFDDNGMSMTNQTINSGAGIYLITKKEA